MNNVVRQMHYIKDNGGDPFSDLTPAQRRRIRKHHNRVLGENGPGKVTPKHKKRRPVNPAGGHPSPRRDWRVVMFGNKVKISA